VKEQKSPRRGDFTPSKMSAGRRHFEAYFGALPRTPLKKLFGKSFFRIFKSFSSDFLSKISVLAEIYLHWAQPIIIPPTADHHSAKQIIIRATRDHATRYLL
jgi:hypothetical protein